MITACDLVFLGDQRDTDAVWVILDSINRVWSEYMIVDHCPQRQMVHQIF